MMAQLAAWRNLDETYTLRTGTLLHRLEESDRRWAAIHPSIPHSSTEPLREEIRKAGGHYDPKCGDWIVPESALGTLNAYRIFVVILANYCCNSATMAEVRARDIDRGKVFRVFCPSCGERPTGATLWEVPIIEFCGEGEEGRLTYEAAFQSEIEGHS